MWRGIIARGKENKTDRDKISAEISLLECKRLNLVLIELLSAAGLLSP